MTGAKSRWADDDADAEIRKREKEEKKRVKAEKDRLKAERKKEKQKLDAAAKPSKDHEDDERPIKRRRLSQDGDEEIPQEQIPDASGLASAEDGTSRPLLQFPRITWTQSRNVDNFERLNHIEEGSYGWVSRARDLSTGAVVALKKLKMDNSGEGFPVTALREIQALRNARHRHIVNLIEVIVGKSNADVYLVMDFIEHDLKTLQEGMAEPFLLSEIKTLMIQIVAGVGFLHDNWILHRDLKTSNILMNNRGEIKLADFGMARQFSNPPPLNLTQLVVTLWYRAPELLLGTHVYGPEIDIWSIGCIFGELVLKAPLIQGKTETDQLSKIFNLVGVPTEKNWPGFRRLPNARALRLPVSKVSEPDENMKKLRLQFPTLTSIGVELLSFMLSLNPSDRLSADEVLGHDFFAEKPKPKPTAMFPTFPSKAGGEKRRRAESPNAPKRGEAPKINVEEFSGLFSRSHEEGGGGFSLKLG